MTSCSLDIPDSGYGTNIPFTLTRSVGTHLPPGVDRSPKGLFQLLFSEDLVDYICSCSDKYAESMKNRRAFMYKKYNAMSQEDFLNLGGMLIHFGY